MQVPLNLHKTNKKWDCQSRKNYIYHNLLNRKLWYSSTEINENLKNKLHLHSSYASYFIIVKEKFNFSIALTIITVQSIIVVGEGIVIIFYIPDVALQM